MSSSPPHTIREVEFSLLNPMPADPGRVRISSCDGNIKEILEQEAMGSTHDTWESYYPVMLDEHKNGLDVFIEDKTTGKEVHVAKLPLPDMDNPISTEIAFEQKLYHFDLGRRRNLDIRIGFNGWQAMNAWQEQFEAEQADPSAIVDARPHLEDFALQIDHAPRRMREERPQRSTLDWVLNLGKSSNIRGRQ